MAQMKVNIIERADGSEGVYIRGDVMGEAPEMAEYRASDGTVYYVAITRLKVELDINDGRPSKKEKTHEQPGS